MKKMEFIYPDLNWYSEISDQKNVPLRCPYANVHRCQRYYSSLCLLGDAGITTKIETEKIKELDELWNKSYLLPIITEHDTSIIGFDDKKSDFSNFCPEVSFDVFGLFAVSLHRYTDEFDRNIAYAQLEKETYPKDWRWNWAHVEPLHYLKCPIYLQLITRPAKSESEILKDNSIQEIIEVKPGFMGISLNIRAALSWLAKWWLSKQQR